MAIRHKDLVAKSLRANPRGDFVVIDPGTSAAKTICGIFSYETIESNGVEVRAPVMRIASCERGHLPRKTKVRVTSEIHDLDGVPAEVVGNQYSDSSTVNIVLTAVTPNV